MPLSINILGKMKSVGIKVI